MRSECESNAKNRTKEKSAVEACDGENVEAPEDDQMTVSIEATSKKYRGRKAETYESVRTKQKRWKIENDVVWDMLRELQPNRVLDVPVGTGRFIQMYDKLRVQKAIGVDISDEMLEYARVKAERCRHVRVAFLCDDVRAAKIKPVDVAVCVRFLDLIDERAMRVVLKRLMQIAQQAIICTIRLGDTYIAKSNTATHAEGDFRKLLKKYNWRIARDVPVFTQGWHVFLLKPRS